MGRFLRFVFLFILLALRPTAKSAKIFDVADILRLFLAITELSAFGVLGWSLDRFAPSPTGGEVMPNIVPQTPEGFYVITFLILGILILFFIAGVRLLYSLDSFEKALPQLVFSDGNITKGASFEQLGFVPPTKEIDKSAPIGNFDMLRVGVRNEPEMRSSEAEATKAIIRLTFYDMESGEQLLHIWGRWSSKPQPGTLPSHMPIDELREMNIPPNSNDYWIEVAIQYEGEDNWFAFNDQALRYGENGRWDIYALPKKLLALKVYISAGNMKEDAVGWYKIHSPLESPNDCAIVIPQPDFTKTQAVSSLYSRFSASTNSFMVSLNRKGLFRLLKRHSSSSK